MVRAHSPTNKEAQLFPSAKTRGILRLQADDAESLTVHATGAAP